MRQVVATPAVAALLLLGACGGSGYGRDAGGAGPALRDEVVIDGSSTVAPLTIAAAELFAEQQPGVRVSVATSGTGGGFEKFCRAQTDISDASRRIRDAERGICIRSGVQFVELQVAADALTVVTGKGTTFLTCLTTAELKRLWEPAAEGKIRTWNQVRSTFPAESIALYGPGTDSGTFDYFTAKINGQEGSSRTDYNASEDDNIVVQGVSGSQAALGYIGFTYFEENTARLKVIQVDAGSGCVTPSVATAQDGSYAPLSRPLFIYVSTHAAARKPQVKRFVDFYVTNDLRITEAAQFIPLSAAQQAALKRAAAGVTS